MADAPRLRNGHTRVHSTDDTYLLPMAEYTPFRAAWEAGHSFWTGYGFYGSNLTIKLARVEAVELVSLAALAACTADERADDAEARRDAMLHGDD